MLVAGTGLASEASRLCENDQWLSSFYPGKGAIWYTILYARTRMCTKCEAYKEDSKKFEFF